MFQDLRDKKRKCSEDCARNTIRRPKIATIHVLTFTHVLRLPIPPLSLEQFLLSSQSLQDLWEKNATTIRQKRSRRSVHSHMNEMSYFRGTRSSRPTWALGAVVFVGFLYFLFFASTTDLPFDPLLRQRKADAAAANPLSPPTAAFRKSSSDGKQQPLKPPPIVHYQLNNLTASSKPEAKGEKVLILTPLARFYQAYWDNLVSLSYPHEHISLGFIIPKTKEGNEATKQLQDAIKVTEQGPLSKRFRSIMIMRQDFSPSISSQDEKERHKMSNQAKRRADMALARNQLLVPALGPDTSWVLWLDGDIVETPPTLIQDLASFDRSIIVPNCFQRYKDDDGNDQIRPYDYNSWRDSETAQELARKMGPDEVILEGYAEMATYRSLMAMLADIGEGRDRRRIMPLDGVGGTALLVKAEVHRDGAMFPPFSFYHLIETEGFAKMAKRLGYDSWGLPNYFVSNNTVRRTSRRVCANEINRCTTTMNRLFHNKKRKAFEWRY